MDGFAYDEGEPPRRPATVQRFSFADAWPVGADSRMAPHVVPMELLQEGDTQAGVFRQATGRPGDLGEPVVLDPIAAHPGVDSILADGRVIARTPLPGVRWLRAGQTDEETLRNLPGLEALEVYSLIGGRASDRLPLDPDALPASVRWLACDGATFGSPEALAARLPRLERLKISGLWRGGSAEPLAALGDLRWLATDAAKGLQHLGGLTGLELLELDLAEASLANLKRFGKLTTLRVLRLDGAGLKSLGGIEPLTALEELALTRTAVDDLAALAGLPALADVRLAHAPKVTDLAPLGTLPALRRLSIHLGDVAAEQTVPSLAWLSGATALEELELEGLHVADGAPAPLAALPRLRRADVDAPATDEPESVARIGPVPYRRLPDGTWSIFTNVAIQLGTDTNHGAEDRARGAIRDEDLALYDRLTFDSEADALAITAASEDDIRRAATVIAALVA